LLVIKFEWRSGTPRHQRLERRAALLLLLTCFALPGLGGCGGDEGSSESSPEKPDLTSDRTSPRKPELLSAGERSDVREARVEIRSYCHELTLYLARKRGAPTERETGRAFAAVDRLVAIARDKPSAAQAQDGRTVRDLLGDIAEDLEGSNCAANVEQRIEQALVTLPAQ
jgi:hypothetical protein